MVKGARKCNLMSEKLILVTAATGHVGSKLIPQLLDSGARVRGLTHSPSKKGLIDERAEVVVGDLDKPDSLKGVMEGVTAVYAVTPATTQLPNLLYAAKEAGAEHIVRQSTLEAGAVPPIGPGKWHRESEKIIEASGLAWTHLRPTMMMVNTPAWWAKSIQEENTVSFPGGEGRISPVDPSDIAAVAKVVLTAPGHEGHAYDVTGPELITTGEMVAILSRVLGKPIRYVDIPETTFAEPMAKMGLPPYVVEGLVQTFSAIRGNRFAYVADTVERLTGRPGRTYEMWVRENVKAFSTH
jgi:(4-alkanoyl-5-oxo-2,5-dihydrofuran-3-yl)methyl phosphate reductase